MVRVLTLAAVLSMAVCVFSKPTSKKACFTFPFVSRQRWGAREPTSIQNMDTPVPYVVIHHSYEPSACYTFEECAESMRFIQDLHQIHQGWADIGYSFAVGSDGAVYEGRGWDRVGAHAVGYNTRSIGIVLIGDWVSQLPPQIQLDAVKKLIAAGVELGYISPDYILHGHRQLTSTECPGEVLYKEISTWDRYQDQVIV